MSKEDYLDKTHVEFERLLYEYISPKIIDESGYSSSSFNAKLSENNNSFFETEYYYKETLSTDKTKNLTTKASQPL